MECEYCIDNLNLNIKIADIERKCKYHKKKGVIYPALDIAPKKLCWELFYAVYPDCLAVLYNGSPLRNSSRKKGMQEIIGSCPMPDGIKVKVKSVEILPAPLRVLKELMEEFTKKIYRAFDAPFRKVLIEVIETNPKCPKDYKIGDTFMFNINKKDELCPAGFAAIYPYFRLLKYNTKVNGLSHSICVHCPDYIGVTYEITTG